MFEAFAVLMTCPGRSGLSDVSRIVQSNATCDSSPFVRRWFEDIGAVYSSYEPRLRRALWCSRIAAVVANVRFGGRVASVAVTCLYGATVSHFFDLRIACSRDESEK